jgi:hypothetical protein
MFGIHTLSSPANVVYGTVYIVDDNADMNVEIWKEMQEEIKAKKNKTPPPEIVGTIKNYENMLLDDKYRTGQKILSATILVTR